jgi:1,4-dihydroxy-2-naphthoate octaprenyltransferase
MGASRWGIWIEATRPNSLWAGAVPITIGSVLAYKDGSLDWPLALCALLGALLVQIGANLANDYYDFVQGADTSERIGERRLAQSGLVPPKAVKRAAGLVFTIAMLPGFYILWRGGWVFALVGALAVLFGVLYTAGPYPLAYIGLGDAFVLAFFGPLAVCGAYYLQTGHVTMDVFIAGLALGLMAVALNAVNNLRDVDEDRRSGKRTLAVRFGRGLVRFEYLFCLLVATLAIPIYLCATTGSLWFLLPPVAVLGLGHRAIFAMLRREDGPTLNAAFVTTAKLMLVFSVTFLLGFLLP